MYAIRPLSISAMVPAGGTHRLEAAIPPGEAAVVARMHIPRHVEGFTVMNVECEGQPPPAPAATLPCSAFHHDPPEFCFGPVLPGQKVIVTVRNDNLEDRVFLGALMVKQGRPHLSELDEADRSLLDMLQTPVSELRPWRIPRPVCSKSEPEIREEATAATIADLKSIIHCCRAVVKDYRLDDPGLIMVAAQVFGMHSIRIRQDATDIPTDDPPTVSPSPFLGNPPVR